MKTHFLLFLFSVALQIQSMAQIKTTYYPGGSQKSSEGMLLNAPAQVFASGFDQLPKQQQDQLMASATREGTWKYWYQTGALQSEQTYANGNFTGIWKGYHPDGALSFEINFNTGTAKFLHPNGQVMNTGQVTSANLKTGLWKSYDENGHLTSEGNYASNKKDGTWKWYSPNGTLESEEVFQNGNRISHKKF